MLPGFKSFRIYSGDTFSFQMTLKTSGEAYPISDQTFTGQVKENGKSAVAATFTVSVVNGSQGIIRATLPASESAKLTGGKMYSYDIQMDNEGVISTLIAGPIVVTSDVTK